MSRNQTIFLTGISGLLGTNLSLRLLSDGHLVKGLIRKRSSYKGAFHANLTLVEGDLNSDLGNKLDGVSIVIHAAAETRQNLIRYSHYQQVNTLGTALLYDMAVQANVKQFVFVSSANTIGYGSKSSLGVEETKMKYPFVRSYYARSKKEAEEFLISREDDMQVLIINPTFMIGAYDSKPSSGKIILRGLQKKVIFYPSGGKNFVHVQDVVESVISILKIGNVNERYLVAGENLSFREFYLKLMSVTGQRSTLVQIPDIVLLGLGLMGDLIRYFGVKSNLSSTNMRSLLISNFYSNMKSVKDLGLKYRSVEAAISDAVEYFENH